jgi:hypothetical protein
VPLRKGEEMSPSLEEREGERERERAMREALRNTHAFVG